MDLHELTNITSEAGGMGHQSHNPIDCLSPVFWGCMVSNFIWESTRDDSSLNNTEGDRKYADYLNNTNDLIRDIKERSSIERESTMRKNLREETRKAFDNSLNIQDIKYSLISQRTNKEFPRSFHQYYSQLDKNIYPLQVLFLRSSFGFDTGFGGLKTSDLNSMPKTFDEIERSIYSVFSTYNNERDIKYWINQINTLEPRWGYSDFVNLHAVMGGLPTLLIVPTLKGRRLHFKMAIWNERTFHPVVADSGFSTPFDCDKANVHEFLHENIANVAYTASLTIISYFILWEQNNSNAKTIFEKFVGLKNFVELRNRVTCIEEIEKPLKFISNFKHSPLWIQ